MASGLKWKARTRGNRARVEDRMWNVAEGEAPGEAVVPEAVEARS